MVSKPPPDRSDRDGPNSPRPGRHVPTPGDDRARRDRPNEPAPARSHPDRSPGRPPRPARRTVGIFGGGGRAGVPGAAGAAAAAKGFAAMMAWMVLHDIRAELDPEDMRNGATWCDFLDYLSDWGVDIQTEQAGGMVVVNVTTPGLSYQLCAPLKL